MFFYEGFKKSLLFLNVLQNKMLWKKKKVGKCLQTVYIKKQQHKKRDDLSIIPSLPFGYPIRLASSQTVHVDNILAVVPECILVLKPG